MRNDIKGAECPFCLNQDCDRINAKIRDLHDEDVKIYHCLKCEVQFLSPQKSEEELKRYYDGNYRRIYVDADYYDKDYIENYFYKQLPEAQQRVERFNYELSDKDSILEIGCSSGYFLFAISGYVKEACGIEWDNQNSEYVRTLGFEVKQNIEEYDKKFDKIFMFHVLEHIKKPIEFLTLLKKYLKTNGKIYIEVPNNEDMLISGYDLQEFKDFYYQLAHLWYFNEKSLIYVLKQAGYKGIEIKFIQRYDISNHLWWLKERKPGGMGAYTGILSQQLNAQYIKDLREKGKTDTIMVICTV